MAQRVTSVCLQCGRPRFDPWVGKILWRRKWQPIAVLLPGKSHGQRSLVDYSPWDRKELDTTELLHYKVINQKADRSHYCRSKLPVCSLKPCFWCLSPEIHLSAQQGISKRKEGSHTVQCGPQKGISAHACLEKTITGDGHP